MGRSGGGSHGISGGGMGHHHHPPPPPPPHHHRHRYYYYNSSGGACNLLVCIACVIPAILIISGILVVAVVLFDGDVKVEATLTSCEQLVVCPKSFRGSTITFKADENEAYAYLVDSLPKISKTGTYKVFDIPARVYSSYEYSYWSFNLVAGSSLSWDFSTSDSMPFYMYLVKGSDQMNKFLQDQTFEYVQQWNGRHLRYDNYTVQGTDEFFIIVETSYMTSIDDATIGVYYLRYEVEGHTEKTCVQKCDFDVDESEVPPACVIAEVPCSNTTYAGIVVDISYSEEHSVLFYVCLSLCILCGLAAVGAILGCIACICRKGKGTQGQTYNPIPTSATVDPVYPAGYPQPMPQPSYQQAPVYDPAAVNATGVAAPGTVPYGATYGTATAPPAY